jgi:hypothetical protein
MCFDLCNAHMGMFISKHAQLWKSSIAAATMKEPRTMLRAAVSARTLRSLDWAESAVVALKAARTRAMAAALGTAPFCTLSALPCPSNSAGSRALCYGNGPKCSVCKLVVLHTHEGLSSESSYI